MFVARLICSETECPHEELLEAPTLAELETLACDCGCALLIVGWPDWVEPRGDVVVSLPPRQVLADAA